MTHDTPLFQQPVRLKPISVISASLPPHTNLKVYHWARALGFINLKLLHLNLIGVPVLLWYDFPCRKSVHDPAFSWVPLVPLPELGWIVWNKLQSSLKEERREGEGKGGGSKSREDQGCEGQSRGSDRAESRVSNPVSCPWIPPAAVSVYLPYHPLTYVYILFIHPSIIRYISPSTSAPGHWAVLQLCASVVFAVEHLVVASDGTDPFVCFVNPGFAEID